MLCFQEKRRKCHGLFGNNRLLQQSPWKETWVFGIRPTVTAAFWAAPGHPNSSLQSLSHDCFEVDANNNQPATRSPKETPINNAVSMRSCRNHSPPPQLRQASDFSKRRCGAAGLTRGRLTSGRSRCGDRATHGSVPKWHQTAQSPRNKAQLTPFPPIRICQTRGKTVSLRPSGRSNPLFRRTIHHKGRGPRPWMNKTPHSATPRTVRQIPSSTSTADGAAFNVCKPPNQPRPFVTRPHGPTLLNTTTQFTP
jgi:hypothetical protein